MKRMWIIIVAVVILAALAVAAFIIHTGVDHSAVPSGSTSTPSATFLIQDATTTSDRPLPEGYTEFRSSHFDFSLIYPSDLSVKTYDEGGGAATIAFQDVSAVQGFQIFIVPYTASQVTQAQFLKDEPSGVRSGAKDITIDGATAQSFYSSDAVLGDTAELWFIHGSYLYEVTTLKPLASWLSSIMQTWQFI